MKSRPTYTTVADASRAPCTAGPAPEGWVVETIIEGRAAWMIKPEPLTNYTFTHELEKAHVFEREGEARDSRAAVWCWHDRHGQHPSIEVIYLTDGYRAQIAADRPQQEICDLPSPRIRLMLAHRGSDE